MEQETVSKYAGDEAWSEWMQKCAVSRCDEAAQPALRNQISSAMLARLAKFGIAAAETNGDDPVAFFDSYFALHGSKDAPKPLKAYFAHRIAATGIRLVDFVCGTLFGSASGRIHDIVIEWVAALKGWRPRSLRDADGKRRFVWEGAGDEGVASLEELEARPFDPSELLDVEPLRIKSAKILDAISTKINVEKSALALLYHVEAQDMPITATEVLRRLGTAKSRAYALKDKAMDALRREIANDEDAANPLFIRVFLEECEAIVKKGGAL